MNKTKIKNYILEYSKKAFNVIWNNKVQFVLCIIIVMLCFKLCSLNHSSNEHVDEITGRTDSTNTTAIISYDKDFSDLKKENKELYNSLKEYKDQIDYLLQFSYNKEYKIDTVYTEAKTENTYVKNDDGTLSEAEENTYTYNSNDNDTLTYQLRIGSRVEPSWYSLNFKVSDRFTLVNRSIGDSNETTITTNGQADVTDITVFQKKEKASFFKRFAVGPQVSAGYDVVNNKFGVMVGVGVTYNIFYKK